MKFIHKTVYFFLFTCRLWIILLQLPTLIYRNFCFIISETSYSDQKRGIHAILLIILLIPSMLVVDDTWTVGTWYFTCGLLHTQNPETKVCSSLIFSSNQLYLTFPCSHPTLWVPHWPSLNLCYTSFIEKTTVPQTNILSQTWKRMPCSSSLSKQKSTERTKVLDLASRLNKVIFCH